jgi:ABC-2 type transport system ATP-binding protein
MDEAENCNRITIIDHGKIIALDTPDKLKDSIGGDLVTLRAEDNPAAAEELKKKYDISPIVTNEEITFNIPQGEKFLPKLIGGFSNHLISINIRRPTLDDVFLKLTGRAIRDEEVSFKDQLRSMAMMRRH